jgi:exopolysaccharide biosynthesis protein
MKAFIRVLLLLLLLCLLMVLLPSGAPISAAYAQQSLAPLPMEDAPCPEPDPAAYLPGGMGYTDASLRVRIEELRAYDTTILVARVQITDPSQLRTAMAAKFGTSRDMPGARLARRYNAVLAINGDYFNFDNKGYVLRQGKLYRDNPRTGGDVLLVDDQGDLTVIRDATSEKIAAFAGTVVNAFSFGPALVMDGQALPIEENLLIASDKPTQRMVFGQDGPLSYVCVATEGPENPGSVGLTLTQTAELMQSLGCATAYNLDGGSSSTMVLGDLKINALSSHKVRAICDILYFATLVSPE